MQLLSKEKEKIPTPVPENQFTFDTARPAFTSDYISSKKTPAHVLLKIGFIYIVVSVLLCILLSDLVLNYLGFTKEFLHHFEPYKKWIVVILTLPLFLGLVAFFVKPLEKRNRELLLSIRKNNRIINLNQSLRVINQSIYHIQEKEKFLHEACKIIQQNGNFALVWIGLGDSNDLLPDIFITVDEKNNYIQQLYDNFYHDTASERGEPALTAFRKMQHVIVNDLLEYSKAKFSWRTRAITSGYRSIGAFFLKTTSGLSGVIAMYSNDTGTFNEDEIELFQKLASDIALGLSVIEQRVMHYYTANYNVITHLPNEHLFEDRLKQALSRARQKRRYVGVAVIEINDLNTIITQLGADAGTTLLKETCKHFSQLVRDGDTIASISHHEIGIMLADVAQLNDVATVMQKLLKPFKISLQNMKEFKVHLRAGVAVFPQDASKAPILIKNARDTLMGIQNQTEINCAFYTKEMTAGIHNNQIMEQELQGALEREEFFLLYQPIVDVITRRVTGVEVLIRWSNHKLGEVSPVQFIHVAEEMGLLQPLQEWVLKTACMQLMEWRKKGYIDISLFLNISGKQLYSPNFVKEIKEIFEDLKFNPKEHNFGIEISESAIMMNVKEAKKIFEEIHALGIKISIDDFGTGSASITYLIQLPVDILKIDSMFVRALGKDNNIKALITGVIILAKGLNFKAIAEGVETEKQFETLEHLGCNLVQGYFFSPPTIAKNVEDLFGKPL